ncbi:MAG: DUF4279 domain-containing protein [Propionivibrio sp.]|nr:DUF4279 domain-containing protein [Propionivibrio sp.]
MTNEVEVYFALKGDDFDPDAFTIQSGLTPTKVYRKGEPGKYVEEYKFGLWEISTGRIANDVLLIDELADQLISRIEGSADCIASAVAESGLYAVLEVVLYISMDEELSTPALGFSSKTIAFLHRVGAEIDVDIYRN